MDTVKHIYYTKGEYKRMLKYMKGRGWSVVDKSTERKKPSDSLHRSTIKVWYVTYQK